MNSYNVTFTTASASYVYGCFAMGTRFNNVGGNYMFAYQGRDNRWYPLYIGQTNDLGVRLANHEKLAEAKRKGASHILARTNANEVARKREEADLIAVCKPPCNDLLK